MMVVAEVVQRFHLNEIGTDALGSYLQELKALESLTACSSPEEQVQVQGLQLAIQAVKLQAAMVCGMAVAWAVKLPHGVAVAWVVQLPQMRGNGCDEGEQAS